jgi:hypothetical protein
MPPLTLTSPPIELLVTPVATSRRNLLLAVVSAVGLGVAAVIAFVAFRGPTAGNTITVPMVQTVRLSHTLEIRSGDVVRDKYFIWAGPPDSPMLRLAGTQAAIIDHVFFEVPSGYHATAAVELTNTPSGGPLGNGLSNLSIGVNGRPGNFDYGLLWTGSLNGDSNTVSNVTVFGAARVGIAFVNPQATGNSMHGVYVFDSPIGISSEAGGTITCDSCGFVGSTDVDIELTRGAGLLVTSLYSMQSRALARIGAGPGAGGLSILGGTWHWSEAADGPTISATQSCCYRTWLRLDDVTVTPLGGPDRGSIVGMPAGSSFLSNVAGIAASAPGDARSPR